MTDDRRQDDETRERIEEIRIETRERIEEIRIELLKAVSEVSGRLLRSVNIARVAVLIVGVAVVAALTLAVVLNHERVEDIEDARRETVRVTCEERNARNEATVRELRLLAARDPRPDVEERLEGTIRLIDALAPVEDCDRLVARRVP